MKSGCLIAVVSAVATPVVGLFLLFSVPAWMNDEKLDMFEERFLDYPLPPSTFFSDYNADSSIALRGNGNHCDYRVRISLQTSLSEEEIIAYYDKAVVTGVDAAAAPITVYFHRESMGSGGMRRFIAEVNDSTEAGLDLRCH
ncbi:hypothetical protein ETD86_17555 [Nonomuraea turkmeniaca]|uniref:Uncharacterized protein n=1 Tax=Nonomuraea turkmeniaca TaxID=103838 RepID=A0A5S4G4B5_9ACTN|nr:hypothetical protein [Nonomuraea turkmeniaca]TMR20800.1 hypothetical protein ETD86_17555 [Nonomuraea turkmeniaca]